MTFFKEVENISGLESAGGADAVPALESYVPNSVIYVILYLLALPPNIILAYMGLRPGLINSRVKYPTLGMTLANLFGLFGFLTVNIVYLFAALNDVRLSLFTCSFVRTVLYNSSYVCYFLFPVLAIDQYLYVCQNYEMKIRSLRVIIAVCFAIPMAVAVYDLFLQNVILYDFMFLYIRMSPYTNVFFFFVLAPSFFAFSFICNLLVLSSIVHRQSKTARKQIGRSLNPRQLQHHKSIIYTYIIQAFLPLVLATPYYIANLCFMFNVEIDLRWFVVGEAIVGTHPLTNALISLFFLRPYRRALRRMCPMVVRKNFLLWRDADHRCYNSIEQQPRNSGGNGSNGTSTAAGATTTIVANGHNYNANNNNNNANSNKIGETHVHNGTVGCGTGYGRASSVNAVMIQYNEDGATAELTTVIGEEESSKEMAAISL